MGKWEEKKLSEVVDINSGIALPKVFKEKEVSGDLAFYKVAQMNNHYKFMVEPELTFTKEIAKKNKIKIFPANSILIPKRGGAILTDKKRWLREEASYDSNIMGLKAKTNIIIDEYLFAFMQSVRLADFIDESTIPQINNKHIDQIIIKYPKDLPEQQRIVAKLDGLFSTIDRAITLVEENIAHTQALMGSVLDEEFGRLANEHVIKPIKEFAKTKSGGTPRRSTSEYWQGSIPWLKSGELNDRLAIEEYTETITDLGLSKSSASLFKKGTLLMAMYGATAGKLGILDMDAATNQAVCSIQDVNNQFDERFIFFFLLAQRDKIIRESSGGAQPNISKGYIDKIAVPLPPLQQQIKLAKKFMSYSNNIEEIVNKQTQQLASLKSLKSSLLDQAFKGEL